MVASDGERRCMSQTVRFQETLRRLAMIDEGFVEDEPRLGLGLVRTSALDPKTAALLQVGVSVAIGSSAVWLVLRLTSRFRRLPASPGGGDEQPKRQARVWRNAE
jgi:hypothetical protein